MYKASPRSGGDEIGVVVASGWLTAGHKFDHGWVAFPIPRGSVEEPTFEGFGQDAEDVLNDGCRNDPDRRKIAMSDMAHDHAIHRLQLKDTVEVDLLEELRKSGISSQGVSRLVRHLREHFGDEAADVVKRIQSLMARP